MQAETCAAFQVKGYPTMFLGRAADVAAKAVGALRGVRPALRQADSVLDALEKMLDT